MATDTTKDIIQYIIKHPLQSSREIYDNLGLELGYATIKGFESITFRKTNKYKRKR
jgi:hypothetical protein